ncbi:hypothetical protein 2 [Sanxia picorna-like virus 1]|uniref:hypothetical protein 2 n=1 Tax=Sanxia picorna-like virus 1 TaxID=1923366 RepID=UPI00090A8AA7|nr:hypothetical protein 2 [Sanxia picorna-like virus 1]APG77470.1 hypothetical protein 2 [Sanxia picorna-like virus 1]
MTNDISLSQFMARPIKVLDESLTVGSGYITNFNVLEPFLGNARIANRISNYAYLRGKIHFRLMVTGTPFHYGKLIMAYEPWPDRNTGARTLRPDVRQRLMLPHVCVDVSRGEMADLSFDIIHPFNGVNITNWNTPTQNVGAIYLQTLVAIGATGSTTEPLHLQVFGWMTDVELMLPTVTNIGLLQEQSGEYTEGNVSKAMTTIAAASSHAAQIPILRPYALATQMVAQGMGALAALFGYCKINMIPEQRHITNRPISDISTINATDTCMKLALDVKNEVTVDPRVVGLAPRDEMTIADIAKREWFNNFITWTYDSGVGSILHRQAVTPSLAFDGATYLLPSPSAYASAPFKFWRGTMYVRIEIVGNAFHRGKLRVAWDPISQMISQDASRFNLQYSHIIDLTESRNYEFCIGWGTNRPFLQCARLDLTYWTASENPVPLTDISANGYFTVEVLSPLTSNDSTGSSVDGVTLLVFTRFGDDFEVAEPFANNMQTLTPLFPTEEQSGNLAETPPGVGLASQPDTSVCINQVDEKYDSGWLASTHFGERITSIRQILKRYCYHSLMVNKAETEFDNYGLAEVVQPDFPYYGGFTDVRPVDIIDEAVDFNLAVQTYLNWYTPAFLARRGGIRWKVVRAGTDQQSSDTWQITSVTRTNVPGVGYSKTASAVSLAENESVIKLQLHTLYPRSITGSAISVTELNPGLEFEVPYYASARFMFAGDLDVTAPQTDATFARNFHRITFPLKNGSTSVYSRYVAASDDFQLYFFLYTPKLRNLTPN